MFYKVPSFFVVGNVCNNLCVYLLSCSVKKSKDRCIVHNRITCYAEMFSGSSGTKI